jgi:hypothetical protein
MNGIIADTTTIAVAPKAMIESAIGMETKRGIEMTTETGEIRVETEMTRTETGAIYGSVNLSCQRIAEPARGVRGAQKHEATNHIVGVN